jgi:hypothetical protein
MGVVQRMGLVATDKNDKPKAEIKIHKARPYRGIPPEEGITPPENSLAITAN